MSDKVMEELLGKVAGELQDKFGHWMDGEGEAPGTNDALVLADVLAVLKRRLLPLLKAGQRCAMNARDFSAGDSASADAWDAAFQAAKGS